MNAIAEEVVNRHAHVDLCDVRKFVTSPDDLRVNIRHYRRKIYYQFAGEITDLIGRRWALHSNSAVESTRRRIAYATVLAKDSVRAGRQSAVPRKGFAETPPVSSAASSPASLSAADSQELVLRWLDEARAMFQAGPCGPLLDHEGIHLFDAALSELNLTMLGVLRRKPSARSSVAQPVSRARHLAYRWKQDRAARRLAHLSLPPAATDILFWPRNTTHTVVLAPVMKAMVARGVRCRILACQPRTLREAHDRNVDVTLTQAVWPRELRAARRDAAARAKALNRLAPWTLPDFAGHAAAQIEPVVRYTLTRMLETVYESATSLRAVLAAMHPKAVVVGNDLTAEGRVACRVAAQQGTATAVLMHGTITGIPLNARHGADRIFVFGDAHRRELIEMGIAGADRRQRRSEPRQPAPAERPHSSRLASPAGFARR